MIILPETFFKEDVNVTDVIAENVLSILAY
jgi:hypothetical protein